MKPGTRRRPDQDHACTALEQPLQFLDGAVDDAQRDDRSREDSFLVVERPVLVHPLVEGVDHGVRRQRIVAQALLEQAGQGRPHQGTVDTELVHQRQPRLRIVVGRKGPNCFTHDLPARLAVRVPLLEVLLLRPGGGDHLESRVRDVVTDDIADGDLRPPLHVDVLDVALILGRKELEGVRRLVHVVVHVEHREIEDS